MNNNFVCYGKYDEMNPRCSQCPDCEVCRFRKINNNLEKRNEKTK